MNQSIQSGALVSQRSSVVTLADVCFASGQAKSRQPGSADGSYNLETLEAILVRIVSKCKELSAACPRGSSRNRVTTRASKTTVRVTQSKRDLETPSTRQTPISPMMEFCPGNGHVVDSCRTRCLCSLRPAIGERSVPTSRNRDVLGSYNRIAGKKQGRRSLKDCRKRGTLTPSVGLRSAVNGMLCSRMAFCESVLSSEKSS